MDFQIKTQAILHKWSGFLYFFRAKFDKLKVSIINFDLFITYVIEILSNQKLSPQQSNTIQIFKENLGSCNPQLRSQRAFQHKPQIQAQIVQPKCSYLLAVRKFKQQWEKQEQLAINLMGNDNACYINSMCILGIYKMLNLIRFLQYFYILYKPPQQQRMTDKNSNGKAIRGNCRARLMESAKEVYSCECGKKYLTFSALYLHAKIKHNVRLSTKKSGNNHEIDQDGCKMVKFYFLKQTQLPTLNQTQNSPSKLKDKSQYFKETLQKYRQYLRQTTPTIQIPQIEVLGLLESYIDGISEYLERGTQLPRDITFYFNDFLVYYLPKHNQVQGMQHFEAVSRYGQDLVVLWEWLKVEGMSGAELKLNETYGNPFTTHSP